MFLEWENNSGKFQNNAINDAKQISLSHEIMRYTNKLMFETSKLNVWNKGSWGEEIHRKTPESLFK